MRRPRVRKRLWIFAALAAVVAAIGWSVMRPHPVAVDAVQVERGPVEELVSNSRAGSVRARLRTQVGSQVAGRVAALPFREGAEVEAGSTLVQLDNEAARAQVALARRDLEAARARLVAAESSAQLAGGERARAESLLARRVLAAEALDTARARDRQARAEVDAARAQVQRAQAALQLADTELGRHRVTAPFRGVVNQLYVEIGASVVPGQGLLELMSDADLYVSAPMDELDIGRIRVGQSARVTLDPYPGRSLPAVVSRVAPFVSEREEQNRTMEVELRIQSVPADVRLRPGTSADVEIVLQRHDGALRVPALALLEGERVLVAENKRAVSRRVRTGLRNWDWIEVLDGLQAGDLVITSLNNEAVKPGTRVEVRLQSAPAEPGSGAQPPVTNENGAQPAATEGATPGAASHSASQSADPGD